MTYKCNNGSSKTELFWVGLEVVPNRTGRTDYTGRWTEEAYVQFVNKEVAEKALQKHKKRNWHFMDEKVAVIVTY
jgi:heterogeneous nuclear ribonucleoprotein F/H